jgi:ABC-type transport system involved in multi-copper enzyme maturation permease subunit
MYPLKDIREHVVRKIQVYLGFIFLFGGYGIQLSAIISNNVSSNDRSMIRPNLLMVAGILVCSIIAISLLLKVIQIVWTRITFKRLLINFFQGHEWELVRNTDIAKEMGELLKIPRDKDDSIEDYILKIKKALHIEPAPEGPVNHHHRRERAEMGIKPGKLGAPQVHRATPPRIE